MLQDALEKKLSLAFKCDVAELRVAYGYHRLHVQFRREGQLENVNYVYRLCKEVVLAVRRIVHKCQVTRLKREVLLTAKKKDDHWTMDFVSNQQKQNNRACAKGRALVEHPLSSR